MGITKRVDGVVIDAVTLSSKNVLKEMLTSEPTAMNNLHLILYF